MHTRSGTYIIATVAILAIFAAGFVLGAATPSSAPGAGQIDPSGQFQTSSSTPDMSLFWEAWQSVQKNYLKDADVSDEDKVRGAVAGLVGSLGDPYSEYFAPSEADDFQADVSGNFGGIGAELGLRDDIVTIVSPLKNSPAEAAGLRPGDQIILVDATSTKDMSIEQAVDYIRGPKGTPITLTVIRKGWDAPKEFSITRQDIVAPTLDLEMKDGGIAYIQLYQFNANADRLFLGAIRTAALRGVRGIVLDLRGNPGGYLDVAVNLSGWFLPRGTVVVSEQDRRGSEEVLRANGNAALANMPVVVLIDRGSASAAEILAGVLRDQRNVLLVGETSFGKGTVQEIQDLSDGSLLKLTVAHWVLPSGKVLDHDGLKPDYEVKLTDADIEKKNDTQLAKALELIRTLIK